MDDRTLQFALYVVIAAALYVLVMVGLEIVGRLLKRGVAQPVQSVPVGNEIPAHPQD
jgi:hypothetical protein